MKTIIFGTYKKLIDNCSMFRSSLPIFSSILQEIILISLMCKSFLDQKKFAPKRVIICLSVMDLGLYLRLPLSNLSNWKPFFLSKPRTFMKSFSGQLLASPSHSNTTAFNAGSSRTAISCEKCFSIYVPFKSPYVDLIGFLFFIVLFEAIVKKKNVLRSSNANVVILETDRVHASYLLVIV